MITSQHPHLEKMLEQRCLFLFAALITLLVVMPYLVGTGLGRALADQIAILPNVGEDRKRVDKSMVRAFMDRHGDSAPSGRVVQGHSFNTCYRLFHHL